VEFGGRTLSLQRMPEDESLRAYDQADLLALDAVVERGLSGRALIVLDAFGALACALGDRDRASCADSELARLALRANEQHNGLAECAWSDLDSIEGEFDFAVVKVPRQKALLDAALARIRPHLREGAPVIGAGMTKQVHNSTSRAFERWIGPTTTSLARSRARLLFSETSVGVSEPKQPAAVDVPGEDFRLWLEPGVFAQRGVDAGSARLIPYVPRLIEDGRGQLIADAGCGSGVLTAVAALRNPKSQVVGTDESHLAVHSAQRTLQEAGLTHARVEVADVFAGIKDGSVDLVLSNPPQHQAAALSQALLERFIADSHRVLRPAGMVRMVANRHVNLNVALKGVFQRVRILDQDRRFMVCEASGPLSLSAAPHRP